MRIALTCNGPGELSGWVRPLVTALLRLAPQTDVTLFFVPDDYATGREPAVARQLFPAVRVVGVRDYVRFALRRPLANMPAGVDVVQYLGGDLLHAARVRARLGGRARSYKFARKRDASLELAYAVDAKNVAELVRAGIAPERVCMVGNLVIDGALEEAAGTLRTSFADAPPAANGILILPGSRRQEIAHALPFFVQMAVRLRALRPDLPVAFAISPFTTEDELARSLAAGGHRNAWGARGRVVALGDGGVGLQVDGGGEPFAVVRDAMRHAPRARLAVTLPGTKCIELAALGVPAIVCVPLNAPEIVVINGPLQYIDRIPWAGVAVKRAIVARVDARFPLTAQPNMDLGEAVMPELRGTLMPGEVARRVAAYADDEDARASASQRLRALYAAHAGAAERMARSLLGQP